MSKTKLIIGVCATVIFVLICYSAYNSVCHNCAQTESFHDTLQSQRISCVYAYYEKNEQYKENLLYFLYNGGLLPHVDYYFVVNGSSSVEIPERPNIHTIYRENVGYDFGAWGAALKTFPNIYKSDYVFFLNTSVKGPYTRTANFDWTKPFINLFYNETVKIVGTSINICTEAYIKQHYQTRNVYPHVQSMFFAIDRECLSFLSSRGIFTVDKDIKFLDLIAEKEVGMSLHVLNNNWNINCILSKYKGIDFRIIEKDINPTSGFGDPYHENAYFGKNIDPYDVIFFKETRFSQY